MTSKPPSRKRPLTAEEAELWAVAMRDAQALRRRRTVEHRAAAKARDKAEAAGSSEAETPPEPRSTPSAPRSAPRSERRTPPDKAPVPPLGHFDERQRRKLSRNVDTIDARIDLHGMRQREAHLALRSFLTSCAVHGHRTVLVITGKGTRAEIERQRDFTGEERGVLRRLVPQWLAEHEFRSIVISFATAGPRHGGEGALYVRLRKFSQHG